MLPRIAAWREKGNAHSTWRLLLQTFLYVCTCFRLCIILTTLHQRDQIYWAKLCAI